MPNSDTVPSNLSPKNAQDDALPIAAFRLKNLTDAQRQTIYHAVMANRSTATPTETPASQLAIGTALPADVPLQPLPADTLRTAPNLDRIGYRVIGNKLVLVDPLYREVLAVIAP
jgi:hypothetical protein